MNTELAQLERAVQKVTNPSKFEDLMNECKVEKTPSDSLWWATPKLLEFADKIGYNVKYDDPVKVLPLREQVEFNSETSTMHGICVPWHKEIVIAPDDAKDFQVRTLVHELTHALGARTSSEGNDEITSETTAWLVCKQLGYDVWDFTLPYTAFHYWTEKGKFLTDDITKYTNRILGAFS